ncbi:MAG TPA: hypothetical protein VF070_13565 [Streptosporangiaceae bacterium]
MSFQDPPPRRERLSRLSAFAQYEDGRPSYADPGARSTRYPGYPGSPEYPSSSDFPMSPGDAFEGNPRDAFDRGPRDAFDRDPADTFDRTSIDTFAGGLRNTTQSPPWDVPTQKPSPRATGPFFADPDDEREPRIQRGRGLLAGSIAGFLAAAVALGAANLAAAFVRPQASPIIAVGDSFIDHTPSWLKNFAVQKFGENDKTMLLLGMYVTIALLAMVIGMLAWHHISVGVVALALFGGFGAFVAYTRPESRITDVIPSVVGGVVGIAAIIWLVSAGLSRQAGSRSRYLTDKGDW